MNIEQDSKKLKLGGQDWISECEESLKDHKALCKATHNALKESFEQDPLLRDLPADISSEEVEAQIAVLTGQAISVYIDRDSLPTLNIIVSQSKVTVLDLKKAIKRSYALEQYRNRRCNQNLTIHKSKSSNKESPANISWRYIWRTYMLSHENQPLIDDSQSLSSYGVGNKSVLKFVKRSKVNRLREKI